MNARFEDKIYRCKDCGVEFLFSSGEQEFFASKGFTNTPTRCLRCRATNRARQSAHASGPMRVMHTVICAECGVETKVPFLPRLEKPVYCSTCFDKMRAQQRVESPVVQA